MITTAALSRRASVRQNTMIAETPTRRQGGRSSERVSWQKPLSGLVVYVDAYLNDRISMRNEYGACLRSLGADVRVRLPKKMETLTHLVWKDGDEGIAQRAADAGVTLVSDSWVYACKQDEKRAVESEHPCSFVYIPQFAAGEKTRKAPQARRRATLEPTRRQWEEVDRDDGRCFSSSQRDNDLPAASDSENVYVMGSASGVKKQRPLEEPERQKGRAMDEAKNSKGSPLLGRGQEEDTGVAGGENEIDEPTSACESSGGEDFIDDEDHDNGRFDAHRAVQNGAGGVSANTDAATFSGGRKLRARISGREEQRPFDDVELVNETPSTAPIPRRSERFDDEPPETISRPSMSTPAPSSARSNISLGTNGSGGSTESGSASDTRMWRPGGRGLLGRSVSTRRSGISGTLGSAGRISSASTKAGGFATNAFRKEVQGNTSRSEGEPGAYDMLSDDGGQETENTIFDSTDGDVKAGGTAGECFSVTEADSSTESEAESATGGDSVRRSSKRANRRQSLRGYANRSPEPTALVDPPTSRSTPRSLQTPAWLKSASESRSRQSSVAGNSVFGSGRLGSLTSPKTYASSRRRLSTPRRGGAVETPVPSFVGGTDVEATEVEGDGENENALPPQETDRESIGNLRRSTITSSDASESLSMGTSTVRVARGIVSSSEGSHKNPMASENSHTDHLSSERPHMALPPPVGTPVTRRGARMKRQGQNNIPASAGGTRRSARVVQSATPASGYAADKSAGSVRVSKTRARTQKQADGKKATEGPSSTGEDGVYRDSTGSIIDAEHGWVCAECTLVNQPKKRRCTACHASPPTQAPIGSDSAALKPPLGELPSKGRNGSEDHDAGGAKDAHGRATRRNRRDDTRNVLGASETASADGEGSESTIDDTNGSGGDIPESIQAVSPERMIVEESPANEDAAEEALGETRRLAAGENSVDKSVGEGNEASGVGEGNEASGVGGGNEDGTETAVVRLFTSVSNSPASANADLMPTVGDPHENGRSGDKGCTGRAIRRKESDSKLRGNQSGRFRNGDAPQQGEVATTATMLEEIPVTEDVGKSKQGGRRSSGRRTRSSEKEEKEEQNPHKSSSEPDTVAKPKGGRREIDVSSLGTGSESTIAAVDLFPLEPSDGVEDGADGRGEINCVVADERMDAAGVMDTDPVLDNALDTAANDGIANESAETSLSLATEEAPQNRSERGSKNADSSASMVAPSAVREGATAVGSRGRRSGRRPAATSRGTNRASGQKTAGARSSSRSRSRAPKALAHSGESSTPAAAQSRGTRRSSRRSGGVDLPSSNDVSAILCSQDEMMEAAFLLGTLGGPGKLETADGSGVSNEAADGCGSSDVRPSVAIPEGNQNDAQRSSATTENSGRMGRKRGARSNNRDNGGGLKGIDKGRAATGDTDAEATTSVEAFDDVTPSTSPEYSYTAGRRSRSAARIVNSSREGKKQPASRKNGGKHRLGSGASGMEEVSADVGSRAAHDSEPEGVTTAADESGKEPEVSKAKRNNSTSRTTSRRSGTRASGASNHQQGSSKADSVSESSRRSSRNRQEPRDTDGDGMSEAHHAAVGTKLPSRNAESGNNSSGKGKGQARGRKRRLTVGATIATVVEGKKSRGSSADRVTHCEKLSAKDTELESENGPGIDARGDSSAAGNVDTKVAKNRGEKGKGSATGTGSTRPKTKDVKAVGKGRNRSVSTGGGSGGKRKRGEGTDRSGGGGRKRGKGDKDGVREMKEAGKCREGALEGPVRVAFSGLLPGDRQAAASVVRSLAKGHKPAGARVCTSEEEPFTHLVIPDESRRTLKVLFALCAPLGPNGRPPAVVTVAWLYASLEAGFFVDSGAFCPARYRGPHAEGKGSKAAGAREGLGSAVGGAVTDQSISSQLFAGQRVMVAGVSDPPPDVSERLIKATGAEVAEVVTEATILLAESETQLESWVGQRKAEAPSGEVPSTATSRATKSRRIGSERTLSSTTSSTRNNSTAGAGGQGGTGFPRDKKRAASGRGTLAWGEEEDAALDVLKAASCVLRMPWIFDSVEKGMLVDRSALAIGAPSAETGSTRSGSLGEDDVTQSQEW